MSAAWTVSVQLSWGDYVVGVRDFCASDPAPWPMIDVPSLVRFVDGEPWVQDPSADEPSWRRLLSGERHSVRLGNLTAHLWASTGRASPRPPYGWLLALSVALALAPLSSASSFIQLYRASSGSLIPSTTRPPPAVSAPTELPPFLPPYQMRWVPEPEPVVLFLEGSRCGGESMGEPTSASNEGRYALEGPPDNPDPHLSRSAVGGVTAAGEGRYGDAGPRVNPDSPLSPSPLGGTSRAPHPTKPKASVHQRPGESTAPSARWGRESSLGSDEEDAVGQMWADRVEANRGALGMGMPDARGGIAKGIELRAGGASAGRRIIQAGLVVHGPRPISQVGKALQSHFAGVQACVDAMTDSDRDTRLLLGLRVEPEGNVRLSSLDAPDEVAPALRSCLAERLEQAELPRAAGVAMIEYPVLALRDSTDPTAPAISPERYMPPASPCGAGASSAKPAPCGAATPSEK